MTGRRRHAVVAVAVVVALAAAPVVGCGLPEDSQPRTIANDELPDPLRPVPTTSTTLPPGATASRLVYLLEERQGQDPQVVAVPREVPEPADVEDVLTALLERPEQGDSSKTSRIPPETELLSTELEDGTLTVNLSEEMTEIEGDGLVQAVAQIVFTVTEFDEVDQVVVEIDGQRQSVPTSTGGNKPIVTRADYAELDPGAA